MKLRIYFYYQTKSGFFTKILYYKTWSHTTIDTAHIACEGNVAVIVSFAKVDVALVTK